MVIKPKRPRKHKACTFVNRKEMRVKGYSIKKRRVKSHVIYVRSREKRVE